MIKSCWELHFGEQCNDRRIMDSRREYHGIVEAGLPCMIRAAGELDYFSVHIRLREPDKSEDKAEGGTSMESSIPCSHGERALVEGGRAEAKELHKTSIDGLLIKIVESEGLQVDAGVLDQGTK
ncbi:hypothetical protein GW17_00056642 [Ensete ventricosum]|nr:hypothetical protein GW17_00056642 [Ensete ventricosum]